MAYEDLKRVMDQVRPSLEREEAMLSAILSGESMAQRRRKLSRSATVGLAAALCVMLTITAFAVSPSLREALQSALGLFQPYSQEVEGLCVVDQGIEVRIVSALTDGNDTQVYYEVRDLTGDRLDGYLRDDLDLWPANYESVDAAALLSGEVSWEDIGWMPTGGGSGGAVRYDPDTRTALMSGVLRGDGAWPEAFTLAFDIHKINPGCPGEQIGMDLGWVAPETLKTETTQAGKTVLRPDQNPRPLDSQFLSLSSFGFGDDGVLHVQFKADGDTSQWDWEACSVGIHAYSRSEDDERASRYNGWDRATAGMTDEEIERTDPNTRFERNGTVYWDIRTGITPDDVAQGDVDLRAYDNLVTRPAIEGEWRLEVPVEAVERVSVDVSNAPIVLGDGIMVKSLYLSVLGCTVEADPEGTVSILGYPLAVYLADGRVLSGLSHSGSVYVERYALTRWSFPEPVEPGEVTAIAIGQWYVPIENGVAQPGHWLDEQP